MKKILAGIVLAVAAVSAFAQSAIIRGQLAAGNYTNLQATDSFTDAFNNSGFSYLGTYNFNYQFNGTTWDRARGWYSSRTVSAVDTATVTTITANNLHDTLSIHQTCSAGIASLQIEVSADNTNFIALEAPIAAAATVVKVYTATTVGGTVALSPLSFPYIRITTATCGGGNTSTQTIGMK